MKNCAGIVLFALLFSARGGVAQSASPAVVSRSLLQSLASQNAFLRATVQQGATFEGRIKRIDNEVVTLQGGEPFRVSELIELERRKQHGSGLGVGAVLGAAVGAAFSRLIVAPNHINRNCIGCGVGYTFVGLLVGGIAGGGVGVVLRPGNVEWLKVWPN